MKTKIPYFFVLVIFMFFIVESCKKEDSLPFAASVEQIDQLMIAEMEATEIPSIAACIIKDTQIVWQNIYGFHDLENQIAPTPSTIYLLASISKTITAVAVMQLYEAGLLGLDEDLNIYLPFEIRNPKFPDVPITTRMLLTHSSGLAWPTNGGDPNFNDTYPDDTAPDIYPWIEEYITPGGSQFLNETWKNTAPGQEVQYSNIGGALLGYIVQVISGQEFSEYCKENIFKPLEMHNSGFKLQDVDQDNLATIYHDSNVIQQYSVPHYPASMMRSSLSELSHFLIAIMNGGVFRGNRILKESTVDEMLEIKKPSDDLAFLWTEQSKGWMGHIGGYWGATSSFDFNREQNLGIITLCNTYGKESIYPDGYIYRLLHDAAVKFF